MVRIAFEADVGRCPETFVAEAERAVGRNDGGLGNRPVAEKATVACVQASPHVGRSVASAAGFRHLGQGIAQALETERPIAPGDVFPPRLGRATDRAMAILNHVHKKLR